MNVFPTATPFPRESGVHPCLTQPRSNSEEFHQSDRSRVDLRILWNGYGPDAALGTNHRVAGGCGAVVRVGIAVNCWLELSLSRQVFSGGLADSQLWSNQATLIDVGVNWYLNKFVKIYLDWKYASFGQPVMCSPGHFSTTNTTYWARFQVYY